MKPFLLKVFLFLLPVNLAIVAVELQLRTIPNAYSLKKTQLDNLCEELEILCLGSSHAFFGINPVYFSKKAYNAANFSQTFDYDQKILEKYIDKMPALKTVMMTVSYFSFFEKLEDSDEVWRKKYYALSMEIDKPDIFDDYLLFSNDRHELVPYWLHKRNPIPVDELGFGIRDSIQRNPDFFEKNSAVTAKRHTISNLDFRQEEMRNIMEEIILLCKSRNISVVLLIPPAHQSYRNKLDQRQLNLMYSLIDAFRQQHHHVMIYDAFADPEFVNGDFSDVDHLSRAGARKLTEKLDLFLQD